MARSCCTDVLEAKRVKRDDEDDGSKGAKRDDWISDGNEETAEEVWEIWEVGGSWWRSKLYGQEGMLMVEEDSESMDS